MGQEGAREAMVEKQSVFNFWTKTLRYALVS